MKLLILFFTVCLVKITWAQVDCDALVKSAQLIEDKFNIGSRLDEFYDNVKDFTYEQYKASCDALLKDYNTAIDQIVKDLAACPGRQKKFKIAKFVMDFSCSFDKDFMKSFFSRFEQTLDQVCVGQFKDVCWDPSVDYCNPTVVANMINCANTNMNSKYCGFEIEIYSKLLRTNLNSSSCKDDYIIESFLE